MDGHAPLGISKDRIARLISDRLTFGQHTQLPATGTIRHARSLSTVTGGDAHR
jgi:hypothetical protein